MLACPLLLSRRCQQSVRQITTWKSSLSISTVGSTVADLLYRSSDKSSDLEAATVHGFVRSVRRQKRIAFAAIGDGSCLAPLQLVLRPEQAEELTTGAAVTVTGSWKACPPGKKQTHELHVDAITIRGNNDVEHYPLQKKYHSPEFLRTIPHLRSRSPQATLLLRLRSQVIADTTTFFVERGFVQTHTPIITSSDCEGAGEVFAVASNTPGGLSDMDTATNKQTSEHFFKVPKYLTVSSQLHLEALAQSVGRVWTLSPTFRAEKSETPRHLSEFYMLEAEMSFVNRADEIMDVVEAYIRSIAERLTKSRLGEELLINESMSEIDEPMRNDGSPSILKARWKNLVAEPWPRITYHEAENVLRKATAGSPVPYGSAADTNSGFSVEHERKLAEVVGHDGPVFVTDYPAVQKPFYMAPSKDRAGADTEEGTVACFDLLLPDVCEVVGGSMREHRLDRLQSAMHVKGLLGENRGRTPHADVADAAFDAQRSSLEWYLDLRRYGSVPHGGFGLGFDRLLCFLGGISNIRDTVTFPRWHERCEC